MIRWTLALALLMPFPLLAEVEDPPLRFDPFEQPATGSRAPDSSSQAGPWSPELRATLAAGPDSLANLGGVVLRIGEETHGYKLVEVRESEAVFMREDVEVTLRLRGPRESKH